jgi:hypothetical protein
MELGVVAAVLGAAFLHAFWNSMVRRADDKALGMASVMIGHVPLAVPALITSYFIAAYTIVDGTGTQVAQNAMIYFGMTSICSAVVLVIYFQRFYNGVIKRVFTESWRVCLVGGSGLFYRLWGCVVGLFVSANRVGVIFA